MDTENKSAAGLWADLWEVYMRENRALRARAEALEGALAQACADGEAAGYRRAIDEACAALDKRYDVLTHRIGEGDYYGAGRLHGLDIAEEIVRALAPVEPVSKADELLSKGGV